METQQLVPDAKKPWESKTTWVALVMAAAAFVPPVQAVIVANPALAGTVASGLMLLLRRFTNKPMRVLPLKK